MKFLLTKIIMGLIVALLVPCMAAAVTAKDEWRFSAAAYGWMPEGLVSISKDGVS